MISIKVREREVEMRWRTFFQQTDMKQQVAATCVPLLSYVRVSLNWCCFDNWRDPDRRVDLLGVYDTIIIIIMIIIIMKTAAD